jgi:uncharacterized protein YdiU (UPF0061 family)
MTQSGLQMQPVSAQSGRYMAIYPKQICQLDVEGRFRFDMQPLAAEWNLSRLGRTLVGLIAEPLLNYSQRRASRAIDPDMLEDFDKVEAEAIEPRSIKTPSFAGKTTLPLDILFHATKGENIVREIVREYEVYFLEGIFNQSNHLCPLKPGCT